MTHPNMKSLRIVAALSILSATPALAEPGSDSIMLERIGAVRMATPDEVKQASAPARDEREQHQNSR